MKLTVKQLNEVKKYLEDQKRIVEWMNENEIGVADIKPREIMEQLKAKFGDDDINTLMQSIQRANFGQQIPKMISRMLNNVNDVERCDSLIAKIQDALVTVQAKKAELEG